jgi:hypothetical protein
MKAGAPANQRTHPTFWGIISPAPRDEISTMHPNSTQEMSFTRSMN